MNPASHVIIILTVMSTLYAKQNIGFLAWCQLYGHLQPSQVLLTQ